MPVPTPHTMMPKRRIDEEVIVNSVSYSVMDPNWSLSAGSGSRSKDSLKGKSEEISCLNFKNFIVVVIKSLEPHVLKCWIRIRIESNADPKNGNFFILMCDTRHKSYKRYFSHICTVRWLFSGNIKYLHMYICTHVWKFEEVVISPFFFQKNQLFFQCCKVEIFNFFSAAFFQFLVIETLDPDLLEMLDPDLMNPDPQHCFFLIFVAKLPKGG